MLTKAQRREAYWGVYFALQGMTADEAVGVCIHLIWYAQWRYNVEPPMKEFTEFQQQRPPKASDSAFWWGSRNKKARQKALLRAIELTHT